MRYRRWIVIVIVAIIAVAILISATRSHPVPKFILDLFNDWSVALSAAAAIILAIIAFSAIMENRRIREEDRVLRHKLEALDEISDWTYKTLALTFSIYIPNEQERQKVRALFPIQSLAGASILAAAGLFGEEMVKKVSATEEPLHRFEEAMFNEEVMRKDKTIRLDLQHTLCEVLKVVYKHKIELLPYPEYRKRLWTS